MRISRNMSSSKGATVVEFALLLPIFLFLVFGAIEFGWYFFVRNTIQSATRDGTRLALVGMQLQNPNKPTEQLSRVDSIIKTIQDNAAIANVKKNDLTIWIYPVVGPLYTDPLGWQTAPPDAGQGGQCMRVRTQYTYHFLTPIIGKFFGGANVIQAAALYRNELFLQ